MSFNLVELVGLGLFYLAALFFIAFATERGWIPKRITRHPAVYILSLGVYCSAWAVYGSVGFAYENGYNFLAYYLGIAGAFLIAPITLAPFLRLAHTYKLNSLADLFTYRYRSPMAGAGVTIFLMLGLLPLLAMQIQAVAHSVSLLNGLINENLVAFFFCLIVTLFTSMYGGRSKGGRTKKHEGLVVAIAFESLIKIFIMLAIGGYALYGVFNGPGDLEHWLGANPESMNILYEPLKEGPWRSLILIFFAASIVMPHMYQMTFTESTNPRFLLAASWGFPLILFLIALAIPPILWAGIKMQSPVGPEYFTLGIGLSAQSPLLALLAYIGALSASSGIIIVVTLALAEMSLNHLAIPIYKPNAQRFSIRWMKLSRRVLILFIILSSYLFYLLLDNKLNLTQLGTVSYTATMNFVPGILGLLFWNKANRQGVISGLVVGFVLWGLHFFLPAVTHTYASTTFVLTLADIFDEEPDYVASFITIACNALTFALVSLLTKTSEEEQRAAEVCALDTRQQSSQWELAAGAASEFVPSLAPLLGESIAMQEVEHALHEIKADMGEKRAYALIRLRDRLESNLSDLMGPALAQEIMDQALPYKQKADTAKYQDVHRLESRIEMYRHKLSGLASELDSLRRFHRQTLEDLPIGVLSLGEAGKIQGWNRAMKTLTQIEGRQLIGTQIETLPEPWATFLMSFVQGESSHLPQAEISIGNKTHILSLHKAVVGRRKKSMPRSLVIIVEELTELRQLESELIHSERLASIGRFAAGIAHEVGNPITGIACLAQNIRYDTDDEAILEAVEQILVQTSRVTRIVQSLVNFSHAGELSKGEHVPVNLHQCVSDAMDLLRLGSAGKAFDYQNLLPATLFVLGDAQRFMQVFVNLLSNAQDASQPGGVIRVSSELQDHSVLIYVDDEGEGIPVDLQDRIFEPFVTTKEPGKGTGLGLALVYGIIEEHYGHIAVKSPLDEHRGRGTRFIITLPISNQLNQTNDAIA
ncbi:MAG TPA: ATP-binding protein [Pseudomonadales bacterium]|nr:ATP-binding protein [Pseudomonadales bacterium]